MKNSHRVFSIIIAVFLVIYINLLFYQKSFAFGFFGGAVTLMTPPCTNGMLLTIGGPYGGLFLLPLAGARIYSHGNTTLGSCTLGAYIPGGACIQAPPAPPILVKGIIALIGTSAGNFFCKETTK